jgi:hypothetical protein
MSEGTGAGVYVFSNGHCPPHVHARHRGEEWIAKVRFSYLSSVVELWSIEPTRHVPRQRVINQLLDDVRAQLANCRQSWWATKRTTCLENQWALLSAGGTLEPLSEHVPEAKQIAEASYDAGAEQLRVVFYDGASTEMRVET